MAKTAQYYYSQYSRDALALMGQLIREGRIKRRLTTIELAERVGISRSLLQRIERGDPGCSIGAVFEVAANCGIGLFGMDQRQIGNRLDHQREKLELLPKSVRYSVMKVKDDF